MLVNASVSPVPHSKSPWSALISYVVAAGALFWVFHGINAGALLRDFSAINWPLACAGMVFDVGRYLCQSVRWKLLLSSFCRISAAKTFRALYAGVFLNMVFPLRIGEVARAYIVSRDGCLKFSSALSSLLVEYLFDGMWLAMGIGSAALFLSLPDQISVAARILGTVILLASAVFCIIVFREIPVIEKGPPSSRGLIRFALLRFHALQHSIRTSLKSMSKSRFFIASFFLSGVDLFFHMGAFWIIMRAYGIHLPFFTASAVVLFVFVGLIVPNAPSNVGSFQFFCVIALMAVGIDKTQATGFSLLVFVLVSIPQMTIGSLAFASSGRTLSEIRNEVRRLRGAS